MSTNKLVLVFSLCLTTIYINGCKDIDNKKETISKKPNIVFILADDLGAYDLSYAGSKYYETPNIDAIASEGVQFTQGYASCQVCSPSRASLMTGQDPARHGITDWIGAATGRKWGDHYNTKVMPPDYQHALADSSITIAEALKQNGYKTFFAGKWHLGDEPYSPENNGFDINKGGWEVGGPKGGYYAPWRNPKLDYKYKGENLTKRLALETADFIEANKEKPFFAYLSFYAVHGPIETTEAKWKKYRDKAEAQGIPDSGFEMEARLPIRNVQDNPVYAGLVESMDNAVGVVLDKLKELGLDDNTIVIFTSDNGGVASGDAFSTTNYPLRGGKGYQWEGGIREPYLIKVPMLKNTPKQVAYPVSGIDFYPTLLDLVGAETNPNHKVDGISLLPLLNGGALNERALFWHYPHYGNQGGDPVSIIRKGDYKLIHFWEDGRDELYNLTSDPSEKHNISKEKEAIVEGLRTELDTYLKSMNAKTPEVYPNYDIAKAKEKQENRRTKMLQRLEKQRKDFLSKDFKPNEDWYNSSLSTKD
ncbi:sulfatase [Seonamhaeicola aphaedonensis]|uniref:Arylsulfatase A-like enzyme n=1 Tax=Seonamhaeicola aphaedonensis TaxID=1461338 RepID=A0A3D9HLF4_9FLAO|nr:sulfatase [Seonamhaeicola aphaedonensis]RED50327.1 arylsulfatase A-like enzyme [Seonamhaeicola aphaedonensis]